LSRANPLPLASALPYISQWIAWATQGQDFRIWCQGANFDCPLLEEVFRRANVPCPWAFWQVRDTRTLYDMALIDAKQYAVPPPHVALNDAIGQTRACKAAMAVLARAHTRTPESRRQMAELAVSNGEVAAQLEIKDTTLRSALVDNIVAACT
jgi:hypothetical protein